MICNFCDFITASNCVRFFGSARTCYYKIHAESKTIRCLAKAKTSVLRSVTATSYICVEDVVSRCRSSKPMGRCWQSAFHCWMLNVGCLMLGWDTTNCADILLSLMVSALIPVLVICILDHAYTCFFGLRLLHISKKIQQSLRCSPLRMYLENSDFWIVRTIDDGFNLSS